MKLSSYILLFLIFSTVSFAQEINEQQFDLKSIGKVISKDSHTIVDGKYNYYILRSIDANAKEFCSQKGFDSAKVLKKGNGAKSNSKNQYYLCTNLSKSSCEAVQKLKANEYITSITCSNAIEDVINPSPAVVPTVISCADRGTNYYYLTLTMSDGTTITKPKNVCSNNNASRIKYNCNQNKTGVVQTETKCQEDFKCETNTSTNQGVCKPQYTDKCTRYENEHLVRIVRTYKNGKPQRITEKKDSCALYNITRYSCNTNGNFLRNDEKCPTGTICNNEHTACVSAQPSSTVSPKLNCVIDNGDNTLQAYFGYENTGNDDLEIKAGVNNKFEVEKGNIKNILNLSDDEANDGKEYVEVFKKGEFLGQTLVVFDSNAKVTYTLFSEGSAKTQVTADINSPKCLDIEPFYEGWETEKGNDKFVQDNATNDKYAIFGYENPNSFPIFLKAAPINSVNNKQINSPYISLNDIARDSGFFDGVFVSDDNSSLENLAQLFLPGKHKKACAIKIKNDKSYPTWAIKKSSNTGASLATSSNDKSLNFTYNFVNLSSTKEYLKKQQYFDDFSGGIQGYLALYDKVVKSAYCKIPSENSEYGKNPTLLYEDFNNYLKNALGTNTTKYQVAYDNIIEGLVNFEDKLNDVIPNGVLAASCNSNDEGCYNYEINFNGIEELKEIETQIKNSLKSLLEIIINPGIGAIIESSEVKAQYNANYGTGTSSSGNEDYDINNEQNVSSEGNITSCRFPDDKNLQNASDTANAILISNKKILNDLEGSIIDLISADINVKLVNLAQNPLFKSRCSCVE